MIKKISSWFATHWLTLIAMCAVVGALVNSSFPYAYFQLMNWAVVGAAILIALRTHNKWIMWFFITVAVLFNPLAPIFLRTDIWQIADIVVIVCFLGSLFLNSEKE